MINGIKKRQRRPGTMWLAALLATTVVVAAPARTQEAESTTLPVEAAPAAAEPAVPSKTAEIASAASQPVSVSVPTEQVAAKLTPMTRDELAQEAAEVLKLARGTVADLADAKIAVQEVSGEQRQSLQARIDELVWQRRDLFDRLDQVLVAWEAKGGTAEDIAEYRQYMNAVTTEGIKHSNVSTILNYAGKWVTSREGGIALGLKVLGFVTAFLVLLFVARILSSLVRRAVARLPDLSTLLANFLVKAAFVATVVLGLLVVLTMMGVNMAPVFAVVGGASFILAFAMQSTLSNFAAGLMIMIYKPFDVGNFVTLAGVSGTVKAVNLVSTTLTTPDNQTITIPNSNVWGSIITNVTVNDTRRVDLVFGIGYADDEDKAQKILEEVVSAHPLVLDDPAPVIRLHELADSSVNFICRPWAKTGDYWSVYWDVTQQVKARFDAAGISIPFPQRDLHVYQHASAG
jgi:small conductance mechanosensitive channel